MTEDATEIFGAKHSAGRPFPTFSAFSASRSFPGLIHVMPLAHVFSSGLAIAFPKAGVDVGTKPPLTVGRKE